MRGFGFLQLYFSLLWSFIIFFQVGIANKIQEYGKIKALGATKNADETTDLQRGHFFDNFCNTVGLLLGLSDCKMRF